MKGTFVVGEEEGSTASSSSGSASSSSSLCRRWEFCTKDRIGHGSFGSIYLGREQGSGVRVAVKVEAAHSAHPQLHYEYKVCRLFDKCPGFPRVHWYGKEGGRSVMVMELLGPSLEELFVKSGHRLQLCTVLALAEQILKRIETMHSRGFVHRDVKPENFLMGLGEFQDTVYMIDFGLAKKYFDRATRKHLPFRDDKKLTGTARYASINTHAGMEQSRRDDLEALGYVLLYLLKGKLPWQGLGGDTKEAKYAKIYECKKSTPLEELCSDLPSEFLSYMRYCRSLSYEEVPNYSSLRNLFRDLWVLRGFKLEDCFHWKKVEDVSSSAESKDESAQTTDSGIRETPAAAAAGSVATLPQFASSSCAVVVDARVPVATKFVKK